MKPNFQSKISADDFPKAGAAFTPKFIQNYASMVAQLSQGLSGQLNFEDNMAAVWQTVSATHNIGVQLYNALPNKAAPKQILVFPGTQQIKSYSWSFTASTNIVSITVNYTEPTGRLYLAKSGSTTSATNATLIAVDWDVERLNESGSLSHSTTSSNTKVICAAAGTVRCEYGVAFSVRVPAAGDGVHGFVAKNGNTLSADNRYGDMSCGCQSNIEDVVSGATEIDVVAGDYLEVYARQVNGAAATRTLVGASSRECLARFRYVRASSAASDSPTVLILGG